MTTLIENLEGRSIFSSTPIEIEMVPDAMMTDMPTMPLRHESEETAMCFQRPAPQWVDAIDPEFFVKPALARAG